MTEKAERLAYLVTVYLNDTITAAEQAELDLFINSSPGNAAYFSEITTKARIEPMLAEFGQADRSAIWQKITNKIPEVKVVPFYQQRTWRYAAAVVILLGAGSFFFFNNKTNRATVPDRSAVVINKSGDVAPGGDKAVLTLANGDQIVLDHASNGLVARQGETKIAKSDNNKLLYNTTSLHSGNTPLIYNTITTPRGGQYQLVLPDGSKVWLNASSSLRFPTEFSGKERIVELKGEGYFEIASLSMPTTGKDRQKVPFKVAIESATGEKQGTIEVLGTHFNIMAYKNEEIKTTLTEGRVKVLGITGQSSMLKPGQQASFVNGTNGIRIDNDIDTEEVLAWKNGQFSFTNASIQTIMEQVSRWYDVDVVFEQNTDNHFSFQLSRDLPVSQLLKILELTGSVHFRVEGKTIIVVR